MSTSSEKASADCTIGELVLGPLEALLVGRRDAHCERAHCVIHASYGAAEGGRAPCRHAVFGANRSEAQIAPLRRLYTVRSKQKGGA